MYLNNEPLQLTSLVIILVCLVIVLVCDRIMKKQSRKTLKHIDFMLDNEEKAAELKNNDLKDSALKMGMSSNADIFSTSHVGARQMIAPISEVKRIMV